MAASEWLQTNGCLTLLFEGAHGQAVLPAGLIVAALLLERLR